MLFVLDNATGRRNLSDLDRIKLAAKREEIVRRMAKSNQGTRTDLSALLANGSPIDSRRECANAANVGEKIYDAGKAILDAVAVGALPAQVVADINAGTKTFRGMYKTLKNSALTAHERVELVEKFRAKRRVSVDLCMWLLG